MFIRYYNRNDKKAQKVSKIKKSVYKKGCGKNLTKTLLVYLSVRLYPKNVKRGKMIVSEFYVGPHMTPGKIYEGSILQKIVSKRF